MPNYSNIENLSSEKISEMYNDIVESNSYLSTVWYVTCDNGKSGDFYNTNTGRSVGYCYNSTGSSCTRNANYAVGCICGTNSQRGRACVKST